MKKNFFALCCVLTPALVWAGEVSDAPAASASEEMIARTHAALKLEIAGETATAQEQLQQILVEFPDAELARWSLGYVRDGENWWKFRRFVEETGRWPKLYRYQQERADRGETFKDQLFLADGCRAHQLHDEEQAHLNRVVRFDSNFQEARQRLGHQRFNGVWITPEQVRHEWARQSRNFAHLTEWRPQAERLVRDLSRASGPGAMKVLQQRLDAIRTPDAIPALESIFARRNGKAASMYLDWVARIPSYEASLALARQAILQESPQLRVQAQSLLRNRPQEDYVPWLLSGLETVRETEFEWEIDLNGFAGLRIHRTLVIDGEQMELTLDHHQQFVSGRGLPLAVQYNPDGSVNARVRQTRRPRTGQEIDSAITPVAQLIQYLNQMQAFMNWSSYGQEVRTNRILQALSEGTGNADNKTPEDWWGWWQKQADYVLVKGKAKDQYTDTWFVDERLPEPRRLRFLQMQVVALGSCFAAGTLVETEQGPKPIESIQMGDRVLAQDVETAELTFKPVFETTVRQKANLLKIRAGSTELTCSQGHPFWVSGAGWRMAKDLQEGARLHTISGALKIDSIQPAGTGTVYNLVVADAHTYFAGTCRFYTHDVTRRAPTDQILPGLRKEF